MSTQIASYDSNGREKLLNISPNGGADVNIQDQVTPTVIVPLNTTTDITVSTVLGVRDARTVTVDDTTGFIAGAFLTITNIAANRYYIGHQVGAVAGNVVTLDRPLDFAFPVGSRVTTGTHAANVNGSVTPQVFSLRAADPGLPIVIDITRVLFQSICSSPVDLSLFGNLPALTNGITLRKTGDEWYNIFTAKSNANMKGLMFDFDLFAATNPSQGVDGFGGRLTFAGQNKLGVAIRVGPDEDIELVVSDDLSTLPSFFVVAEGHVVSSV